MAVAARGTITRNDMKRYQAGSPFALNVASPGNDKVASPMTRRKYEITARMNEQDYPHIVELALPPGGFRARSDAMLAFHRERDIQIRRGQGRNDDGQFYVRYCFGERRWLRARKHAGEEPGR
jgi:hypothetical protein